MAARKLAERKQGPKESMRDFAYHYRALCLRWKKDMTEKELIQAILRNCNPRLASLLRGTVKDVGELVRLGTQIEKDFNESKRYWSQVNSEEQKKKSPIPPEFQRKSPQGANRVVLLDQSSEAHDFKNITIPLILRNSYVFAIVDTGSTFSLIQKSLWKKLSGHEDYQSSGDQMFLLANGQRQSSLGKDNWDCEVQGQKMNVTFYVMQDSDLTVPIILGIDFFIKVQDGIGF